MNAGQELFISVDIEAAGPIPGEYSMLSIGACLVSDPDAAFSCELKPINDRADPAAMGVLGRTLGDYAATGIDADEAIRQFDSWVRSVRPEGVAVVFVGFNAAFDWSFVNYYFHRYLGQNPFGFAALDIKAFYMGVTGCDWRSTRSSKMAERLHPTLTGTHDPLDDARYQAELFRLTHDMLTHNKGRDA